MGTAISPTYCINFHLKILAMNCKMNHQQDCVRFDMIIVISDLLLLIMNSSAYAAASVHPLPIESMCSECVPLTH